MRKAARPSVCCIAVGAVFGATLAACQGGGGSSETGGLPPQAAAKASAAEQEEQIRALEPLLKRPSGDLPLSADADGRRSVSLQSGFRNVVMVERNPDGSHSIICTDSLDRATEFFAGGARTTLEER